MKRMTGTAGLADGQGKGTATILTHLPRLRHEGMPLRLIAPPERQADGRLRRGRQAVIAKLQ